MLNWEEAIVVRIKLFQQDGSLFKSFANARVDSATGGILKFTLEPAREKDPTRVVTTSLPFFITETIQPYISKGPVKKQAKIKIDRDGKVIS
jgi:hypothetical protein